MFAFVEYFNGHVLSVFDLSGVPPVILNMYTRVKDYFLLFLASVSPTRLAEAVCNEGFITQKPRGAPGWRVIAPSPHKKDQTRIKA